MCKFGGPNCFSRVYSEHDLEELEVFKSHQDCYGNHWKIRAQSPNLKESNGVRKVGGRTKMH